MQRASLTSVSPNAHLASLDGFRACLALWVLLGHVSGAVGYSIPVVSSPGAAVDLFMVLSGFLMVYTWKGEAGEKGLWTETTRRFYVARFLRIAPLFYFLSGVCFLWLSELAEMREFTQKAIPPWWVTDTAHYHPHANWDFANAEWLVSHASFLFGLVPKMVASSPLPDWSLSLEMQFYAVLPMLFVVLRKVPVLVVAAVAVAGAVVAPWLFGDYQKAGVWTHFVQPSWLGYRLNAFLAGMLLAFLLQRVKGRPSPGLCLHRANRREVVMAVAAAGLCVAPLNKVVILAYGLMALLVFCRVPVVTWFLGARWMRHLGAISYSIYLAHLLVMIPIIYWLIRCYGLQEWPPAVRFGVAAGVTVPLVIGVSHLLYRCVELPVMRWGARLLARGR